MSSCLNALAGLTACICTQPSMISLITVAILLPFSIITGLFQGGQKKPTPKPINPSDTHAERPGQDHGQLSRATWAKPGLEGIYEDVPSLG